MSSCDGRRKIRYTVELKIKDDGLLNLRIYLEATEEEMTGLTYSVAEEKGALAGRLSVSPLPRALGLGMVAK